MNAMSGERRGRRSQTDYMRKVVTGEALAKYVAETKAAGGKVVGYVTIFDEDTPYELIKTLGPDVLVKGGDWPVDEIVGADVVKASGGEIYSLPYAEGYSTSALIEKIIASEEEGTGE
jgi:bifunctional ADP-heptose synthase (sugar kinase/adenylyltransferase)